MNRKQYGFTLIELMIVIAIIGILAAIAIPSYQDYIRKSRRTDATVAISKIQQAEEKWRANNSKYTGTLSDLGISSSTTEGGYYTISFDGTPTANEYTILATAVSGKSQQSDTNCKVLASQTKNGIIKNTGATNLTTAKSNLALANTDPNRCWGK